MSAEREWQRIRQELEQARVAAEIAWTEWEQTVADRASTARQRMTATRARDAAAVRLQELEACERNLRPMLNHPTSPSRH